MPPTFVVECQKCSGLLLAGKVQRTRTCPYCGTKVQVQKAKRLASAETAFQASEMLRKLKTQNAPAKQKK
jgi:DNA-directed RNA polymerase subunit M/transcription elongation factor TFIIS